MTVQCIDRHLCARHLSLFSSSSHTPRPLDLRTITVGCVHTIALRRGTSSMSGTAPVPSLLLAPESAFPTPLSHRDTDYRLPTPLCRRCARFLKAFLHAMLTIIDKIDRNKKRCARIIDRNFTKLTRDKIIKLNYSHHEQESKCTRMPCQQLLHCMFNYITLIIIGVYMYSRGNRRLSLIYDRDWQLNLTNNFYYKI